MILALIILLMCFLSCSVGFLVSFLIFGWSLRIFSILLLSFVSFSVKVHHP